MSKDEEAELNGLMASNKGKNQAKLTKITNRLLFMLIREQARTLDAIWEVDNTVFEKKVRER